MRCPKKLEQDRVQEMISLKQSVLFVVADLLQLFKNDFDSYNSFHSIILKFEIWLNYKHINYKKKYLSIN